MPTTNWNQPTNAGDYFRQIDKQMDRQERRPSLRQASDILGPGFGPYAQQVVDWNSDTAAFTGFFYSEPGAVNSPDALVWHIGQVISIPGGFGIQRVWQFHETDWPLPIWERRFNNFSGSGRTYSAWVERPV